MDGELCLLLWQPTIGPWETLRVYPKQDTIEVDVEAMLEAVRATKCIVDATELEQVVQLQLQEFPEAERHV